VRRFSVLALVLLGVALAQRAEVSLGSPFGLQGGLRFPLVPLLLDGRVYGGVGLEALGEGRTSSSRSPSPIFTWA
jgi:hypothetical protein